MDKPVSDAIKFYDWMTDLMTDPKSWWFKDEPGSEMYTTAELYNIFLSKKLITDKPEGKHWSLIDHTDQMGLLKFAREKSTLDKPVRTAQEVYNEWWALNDERYPDEEHVLRMMQEYANIKVAESLKAQEREKSLKFQQWIKTEEGFNCISEDQSKVMEVHTDYSRLFNAVKNLMDFWKNEGVHPPPELWTELRDAFYAPLARIANTSRPN